MQENTELHGHKNSTPTAAVVAVNDNGLHDLIELPKPVILINIADDDTARGDTKGRIGLGMAIGRQLDTRVVYADVETLRKQYPDMSQSSYQQKLTRYLTELGCTPDMILGLQCDDTLKSLGREPDEVVRYGAYNETLSKSFLKESDLVSHDLTSEELEIAGRNFDRRYRAIKKPLITIFIANQSSHEVDDFCDRLTDITKYYPEATIFLCGGRRNNKDRQENIRQRLDKTLNSKGQADTVDVISWAFDRKRYNPYKGLIARSDHFIVWGSSQSLVSEPLFAGKTVHTYCDSGASSDLEKRGLTMDFNKCSRDRPFETRHFPPVNTTEDLAGVLIKDTARVREERARGFVKKLQEDDIPASWTRYLFNIRLRAEAVREAPADLLDEERFLEAALGANALITNFLPEDIFTKRPEIARVFIRDRPDCFMLLPEALRDDKDFIESLSVPLGKVFAYLSERLRNDRDFVMRHIEESPFIFEKLSDGLRDDMEIARAAIFANADYALRFLNCCSDRITDDEDFVRDVIKFSPRAYRGISDRLKADYTLARMSLEMSHENFEYFPKALQADRELLRIAVAGNFWYLDYFSTEYLAEDEDFIVDLIEKNPDAAKTNFIRRNCCANKKIMMAAIGHDPGLLRYASPELANDREFFMTVAKKGELYALRCYESDFFDDEDCMRELVEYRPESFSHASERIRGIKDICQEAVLRMPSMFSYVAPDVQTDMQLLALALNGGFNSMDFYNCDGAVKNNKDALMLCLNQSKDYRFFRHAGPDLKRMEDVIWTAIGLDIRALVHVDESYVTDHEFIGTLLRDFSAQLRQDENKIERYSLWINLAAHRACDLDMIPERFRNDINFMASILEKRPDLANDPAVKEAMARLAAAKESLLRPFDLLGSPQGYKGFEKKSLFNAFAIKKFYDPASYMMVGSGGGENDSLKIRKFLGQPPSPKL